MRCEQGRNRKEEESKGKSRDEGGNKGKSEEEGKDKELPMKKKA